MAESVSPLPQILFYEPPPDHHPHFSASPPSSAPARTGHYRTFSTLYTESPYVEIPDKSPSFKRPSSIAGLQSFAHMGIGFKDRAKAKKDPSPLLQVADPNQVKPPRLCPPHYNALQRPSTSSGVINPPPVIRKQRSMVSLFTATNSSASSPSESVPPSQSLQPPPPSTHLHISNSMSSSISKRTRFSDQEVNIVADFKKFVPKNIWAKRHQMKLHPYHNDVPYMQAYDPILLDSDRYSDLLLQRLTHGSPSFHDYGKKPPATVLDLGCGPGHWVLHAAALWKTSQITGLDLVDVSLPAFETTENAHFILGDFIAFKLPFPNNSFDYVRMANLVLCIPYDKWHYLLTEVHRVLTINGRMELIDDQIFFPYGPAPTPSPPSMFDDFDDAYFDDDKETLQGSGSDTGSTLHSPSHSSCEEMPYKIVESPTLRPILPPTPRGSLSPGPAIVTESWHDLATASRELESIFEIMLKQKYKIFPRPSDFVLNRMERVFGGGVAGKTRSYHIKLAPVDSADAGSGADGEETMNVRSNGGFIMKKKGWMVDLEKSQKKTKEKKLKKVKDNKADTSGSGSGSSSERSSLENPSTFISTPMPLSTCTKAAGRFGIDFASPPKEKSLPNTPPSSLLQPDQTQVPIISAKAAVRLGISYSDLAAATIASTRAGPPPPPSSPLQSPGIIVWPSTYIPLTPAELEMHANKYVHTLLGCKPALARFIAQFRDVDGTRFVEDNELHEIMWKYECFRRSRFNWPCDIPDPYDDESNAFPTTPIVPLPLLKSKSGSKSNKSSSDDSYNGLYLAEELTHIRTIRVFEATKLEDRSLASLLFHQKISPIS